MWYSYNREVKVFRSFKQLYSKIHCFTVSIYDIVILGRIKRLPSLLKCLRGKRRCRWNHWTLVGIPDAPTLQRKGTVQYTPPTTSEPPHMSVATQASGNGCQSFTWKQTHCVWCVNVRADLPRQRWLTTSYRTVVMNSWCGARVTGKAYVSLAMIRRPEHKINYRPTNITSDPTPGAISISKIKRWKDRRPLFYEFSQK